MSNPRTGIQLAYPFEERRLLNQGRFSLRWSPPYILQPKLNGERCRLIHEGDRCLLLSSTEEIIPSVPHINEAGLLLPQGEFDGELYVHGWTWAEIHSVVSTTSTMHPNYGAMQLHLFDIITEESQINRLISLNQRFRSNGLPPCLQLVTPHMANTLEEVYQIYEKFIDLGYEGFIIRHVDAPYLRRRSPAMMKFKPKATDEYLITGVYEAITAEGKGKGMVGGFNCIDDMGTPFSVGACKLTHDQRIKIWGMWQDAPQYIKDSYLEVEYQTMSDKNKVPLFSRAVRII